MSLHVVDGMMLEGAFCVRCKANVLVDDSRACPDCGEQVHPLSLSRPDPPAGGTRATITEIAVRQPVPVVEAAAKPKRVAVVPAVASARAWEAATDALIADLEQGVARAAELERQVDERRSEADAALEVARRRHAEARQAVADMRKVRGLVRVDGDAPALTGATAGKPWSRDWFACRHCGTTERAHGGRGLCGRDYQRWMKGAIEGDF